MSQTENSLFSPNRGGYAVCIGNGQLHDALSPSIEVAKTLNCMDDPMKIIIIHDDDNLQENFPPTEQGTSTRLERDRSE